MLVVAPDVLHGALSDYIKFRNTDLATALVSLENVLDRYEGRDHAESLKKFLHESWRDRGAKYVLLVGDADVLPVRYMCLDRWMEEAFHYAFYPSDLYYADVAKADGSFESWNAADTGFHASYFGEVRGEYHKTDPINFDSVDYRPELAVGRWPASTPADVVAMVTKTIQYEKCRASGDAALRHAVMIAVDGWVDCKPFMDSLATRLPGGWSHTKMYSGTSTPPDEPRVVHRIHDGAGLVLHTGHGHDHGWEGSLQSSSIAKLNNPVRTPVIFSAGCSTASFATLPPYDAYLDMDGKAHAGTNHKEVFTSPPPAPAVYARGNYNKTGLGEMLVRAPMAGAVAYIGCNTGSQPCALTLMDGFIQKLSVADGPQVRLGDLYAGAIHYYYEKERLAELKPNQDWYPPSIFFQGMKFMLFGDPALRMPGRVGAAPK